MAHHFDCSETVIGYLCVATAASVIIVIDAGNHPGSVITTLFKKKFVFDYSV